MSKPIDTIRLSRADTMLGVHSAQQNSLEKKNAANTVSATTRAAASTLVESSTHKPKTSADQTHQQTSGTRTSNAQTSTVSVAHGTYTKVENKNLNTPPARSTQSELTTAGKLLRSVLNKYPNGSGPLQGERPLFVSAVMLLRANALARSASLVEAESQKTTTNHTAKSATLSNLTTTQAPRVATSSALASALMQTLQNAVVQSGLFYEAQLVRAILSNRPEDLAQLRDQPQYRAHMHAYPSAQSDKNNRNSDDSNPAQEEFRAIVRRQIELLSTQTIQWQGQPWPQAEMFWSLHPAIIASDNPWSGQATTEQEENEPPQSPQDDAQTLPWCSTMTLKMPVLGDVRVHLWIHGTDTKIRIESEQHQADLNDQLNVLTQRLKQAGIHASSIEVLQSSVDVHPSIQSAEMLSNERDYSVKTHG